MYVCVVVSTTTEHNGDGRRAGGGVPRAAPAWPPHRHQDVPASVPHWICTPGSTGIEVQ